MVGKRRYTPGMGISLREDVAQSYLDLNVVDGSLPIADPRGQRSLKDGECVDKMEEGSIRNIHLSWLIKSLQYRYGMRDTDLPRDREYVTGVILRKQEESRVKPLLYAG